MTKHHSNKHVGDAEELKQKRLRIIHRQHAYHCKDIIFPYVYCCHMSYNICYMGILHRLKKSH